MVSIEKIENHYNAFNLISINSCSAFYGMTQERDVNTETGTGKLDIYMGQDPDVNFEKPDLNHGTILLSVPVAHIRVGEPPLRPRSAAPLRPARDAAHGRGV